MRQRCQNPNDRTYKNYGGRGITVCDRWLESFENFYADMGPKPSPKHSIERKDNDGPYSPENCRWATRVEQGRNRRNNRRVTIGGETKCLSEWAVVAGVCYATMLSRTRRGWLGERLLLPVQGASPPKTCRGTVRSTEALHGSAARSSESSSGTPSQCPQ